MARSSQVYMAKVSVEVDDVISFRGRAGCEFTVMARTERMRIFVMISRMR